MQRKKHGIIIETPTEARQGERGPSVLLLLATSTALAVLFWERCGSCFSARDGCLRLLQGTFTAGNGSLGLGVKCGQAWIEARAAARLAALSATAKAGRIQMLETTIARAGYIDSGPQWKATMTACRDEIRELRA